VQLLTPIVATPVGDLPRLYEKYRFGIVATTTDARDYANALRVALSRSAGEFTPHLETAMSDFDLRTIVNDFLNRTMALTS
jgi:glycosyltransferase involved in cell wall biosynthesis